MAAATETAQTPIPETAIRDAREAQSKWRRSWAGQREARQARKPRRFHPAFNRTKTQKRAERAEKAELAKAERQKLTGDSCPHAIITWDTIEHPRYGYHHWQRVPVGMRCQQPAGHVDGWDMHGRAKHKAGPLSWFA